MAYSNSRLMAEIMPLSEAETWDEARLEWGLLAIIFADEPETCPCGHFPIVELCGIENRVNGNRTIIGNVCVKKFLGLPSGKLFAAVKRIAKDRTRSLNAETISHALDRGWITEWEAGFCRDTHGMRRLSPKQRATRVSINENVLFHVRNGA